MRVIDVHCHYLGDHDDILKTMEALNLKMVNVAVPELNVDWRKPLIMYAQLAHDYPNRFAWMTGMDLPDFADRNWADKAIANITRDVKNGACGIKVWKNIGMEVHKPDGTFVQVDDPIFTPVFDWLAREGITVLAHLAEPISCWSPNPISYYRDHPEWWMYLKKDHPTHAQITAARDRLIARHPKLRFVGAHLASLEYDLSEMARRLDEYPNFAVDMGGRFLDTSEKPKKQARDFFSKYRDRIMFGTDWSLCTPASQLDPEKRALYCKSMREAYTAYYAFHETKKTVEHWGEKLRGLALPQDILELYYEKNAKRWFPGV